SIGSDAPVSLKVYDVEGRLVLTLVSGKVEAGTHNVRWDGTDSGGNHVAPGIYLCRLETAGTVLARKMVLLK
ncbi:MAG: FlgD immunoglobulin-like domain containing protein, partial [bacterium]